MNALPRCRVPCAALLLAVAAGPATPLGAQQAPVAFLGVHVVPMDTERVLENQTVVVRDGRIAAMGDAASTPVPPGAARVDGTGHWLMPGLAEMHGHIPGGEGQSALDVLFLYVAGGATTVRGMQGSSAQIELRRRVEAGELVGPRLVLGSPPLGGALEPETARERVRAYAAAGFDLLKVHEGLSVATYQAIVEEARRHGLSWGGHVADDVGLEGALAAGQATVDHLDNYYEAARGDHARIPELAARTRAAGVAVVPTMALWELILGAHPAAAMSQRPELRYMPRSTVQQWTRSVDQRAAAADAAEVAGVVAFRNAMLQGLNEAGAEILMGTDAPQLFSVPGFSLRRELAAMAAVGMTPYEILRTGTVNVARHLGLEAEAGTVAVGKRADLILLEADPLQDIGAVTRLAGVMVAGRWLDRTALDARLEEMAARNGAPIPLTPPSLDARVPEERVRHQLTVLAHDSMMGRRVGTPGTEKAAHYLAAQLASFGVRPAGDTGYFQQVPMVRPAAGERRWPPVLPDLAALDTVAEERRVLERNVVGIIPGADPELQSEVVVIAAHYDHVGFGRAVDGDSIYNGADDDASGVVAVLEIARALAAGPPPRRTVVVLLSTAEEVGMHGTRYYMQHPVIPLERTVAQFEVEMIGRPDSLAGGSGRAWLTGYERTTMGAELAARGIPLVPDPRPEQNFFQRSDNIVFARAGIPAHTLSSFNLHTDYHQPSDEVERVDFAHMTAVIEAALDAVRILTDGPRPEWLPGGRPGQIQ